MHLYEVNVKIDSSLAAEYEAFLGEHIPKILAIPGFLRARWWSRRAAEEGAPEGTTLWTIHYEAESREALDEYVRTSAPAMRKEVTDRFGDRVSIQRRILAPVRVVEKA